MNEIDIYEIEQIEKTYLQDSFIYGNNPKYTLHKSKKINGGFFDINIELKNNVIMSMNILGDYFLLGDLDCLISKVLHQPFEKAVIEQLWTEELIKNTFYQIDVNEFMLFLFQE